MALGGAAGFFGGQVTSWWKEDAYEWLLQVALPLLAAGAVGLTLVVAAFVVRKATSGDAASSSLVAIGAAIALLAAAPVGVQWNDGCNSHDGRVPLLAAPVAGLVKPENARLSYDEIVTLMACLPSWTLPVQPRP